MPDFRDFKDFLGWYTRLNPTDDLDLHEAMTIYFHLETYGESL